MTAQMTMRFPSVVQYAYVEVTGTAEELGRINPEMAAALFANAMFVFGSAERSAIERLKNGETAILPAPHGPAEEKSHEDHERLLKEELGATAIGDTVEVGGLTFTKKQESPFPEHNEAPYKAAPPAAVKPKPWESSKPAPTVTVDVADW